MDRKQNLTWTVKNASSLPVIPGAFKLHPWSGIFGEQYGDVKKQASKPLTSWARENQNVVASSSSIA